MSSVPFDPGRLLERARAGHRADLGRAITLLESRHPDHRDQALALIELALPQAGHGIRIGISGSPGAGKSTLIEALGSNLTARGHRVAVLAIDPSSVGTGGSILGDKTRMTKLAADPNAFIRPTPTRGSLGGVARSTRDTIVVCEAAGFDVVLVETVGVGQANVAVAGMVDFLMVLELPGGGDALQGIKRGILEHADLVVVTKADGDRREQAETTARAYAEGLALLPTRPGGWVPSVRTCSGITGEGIDDLWSVVLDHHTRGIGNGARDRVRAEQRLAWLWDEVVDGVQEAIAADPSVKARLTQLREAVARGDRSPHRAAQDLIGVFRSGQ